MKTSWVIKTWADCASFNQSGMRLTIDLNARCLEDLLLLSVLIKGVRGWGAVFCVNAIQSWLDYCTLSQHSLRSQCDFLLNLLNIHSLCMPDLVEHIINRFIFQWLLFNWRLDNNYERFFCFLFLLSYSSLLIGPWTIPPKPALNSQHLINEQNTESWIYRKQHEEGKNSLVAWLFCVSVAIMSQPVFLFNYWKSRWHFGHFWTWSYIVCMCVWC